MLDSKLILDKLIMGLIKESGSDIHIIAGSSPTVRINSELIVINQILPLDAADTLAILREMISENQYKLLLSNQQLDFAYTHHDEYRLRCNAFFQRGTIGIAMRLITKVKTLEELNMPQILNNFCENKQGFFLVTGPVGQGKSSTLASMIDHINSTQRKMIVTIEDPIEYLHNSDKSVISQREIGFDAFDFRHALEATFRQDVDVILIGEMRDPETISTAITAAETGHLVLSTMHTNSASQTIDRILDSFSGYQQDQVRAQLSSALSGILAQRLVPKIGGGLIPAIELMVANNAVQNLIREKRVFEIDNVISTSSNYGMISMDQSLAYMVANNIVSMDNAMRFVRDKNSFKNLI
ncbi:MAG: PilT/PilU family type 4a pilus ATPase [Cyanobium sp. MAG06]|nr:PilT/PilU family type 4a pilus ATPase [Cyanobium sp. MAG06]